jgi:hypothetical protein
MAESSAASDSGLYADIVRSVQIGLTVWQPDAASSRRDATVVFDPDGRPILLNRAARSFPPDFVEGLFAPDAPHAPELESFRSNATDHGQAQARIRTGERALLIEGRSHGGQLVVTIRHADTDG